MSDLESIFCLRADHGMTVEQVVAYQEQWGKGPHFAADLAVFSINWSADVPALQLLLVQRGNSPFKGLYATPGGFVEFNEDLEDAARRELQEETGMSSLTGAFVEQLRAYGRPGRDPRARVVTIVFLALVPWASLQEPCAGDDAAQAKFFSLRGSVPYDDDGQTLPLAFDHALVIADAKRRLHELAELSNLPLRLLPSVFTEQQLKQAYEMLSDRAVDSAKLVQWLCSKGWITRVEAGNDVLFQVRSSEEAWGKYW
jgi:8-oxo-dGTP diphosphatase